MAKHRFDGTWSYWEIDNKNVPPHDPNDDGKMVFNIPDDKTGKLEAGSVHGNAVLTGSVTNDAKKISFNYVDNLRPRNRDYSGHVLLDLGNIVVIAGNFKKHVQAVKRGKGKADATAGQDDGTWVITRP